MEQPKIGAGFMQLIDQDLRISAAAEFDQRSKQSAQMLIMLSAEAAIGQAGNTVRHAVNQCRELGIQRFIYRTRF